jgi:hypothetical protein
MWLPKVYGEHSLDEVEDPPQDMRSSEISHTLIPALALLGEVHIQVHERLPNTLILPNQ